MRSAIIACSFLLCALPVTATNAAGWEPSKPIEIIVPAGEGGGADQMARLITEIASKHKLTPQPMVVVNKPGDSGAEGFLLVKSNSNNSHQLLVTLSSLFTLPITKNAKFSWRDYTPIAMMALDQFVLWVNADTPYRSAREYVDAVRAAPGKFRMGGTGSQQEDEIVTRALQRVAGVKFTYVSMKGGGDVAQALADKKVDSTVNNPIEMIKLWQAGKVRPLGVFDYGPMNNRELIAGKTAWKDIPTMKSQGFNVDYQMLRGIFAAPGAAEPVREYYIEVMRRVTQTPEWRAYLDRGALKDKFLIKTAFKSWLTFAETEHQSLLADK